MQYMVAGLHVARWNDKPDASVAENVLEFKQCENQILHTSFRTWTTRRKAIRRHSDSICEALSPRKILDTFLRFEALVHPPCVAVETVPVAAHSALLPALHVRRLVAGGRLGLLEQRTLGGGHLGRKQGAGGAEGRGKGWLPLLDHA